MRKTTSDIFCCNLYEFTKIHNPEGNLTVIQCNEHQFNVKRVFYLYDIPGGSERGGHAHKSLYQLIIAASGSFDVTLDDGCNKKTVYLNRPYYGLMVVPGIWNELGNFSSGAICLVLASEKYSPESYIRDYSEFKKYKNDSPIR